VNNSEEGSHSTGFKRNYYFSFSTPGHQSVWSRSVIEISGRLDFTETNPIELCAAVSQDPIPLFLAVHEVVCDYFYKSHKSLLGFSETSLIHRTLADNHPNILNWAAPVCSLVLPLELNALGLLGNFSTGGEVDGPLAFSMSIARLLGNIPPNRREMLNSERLPQTRQ
jgi:hypothetical protein